MKTIIIFLSMISATSVFTQNQITWVGGTPGQETDWMTAKNWDQNKIPDEFSNVIIKQNNSGHFSQPTLDQETVIASLELQSRAQLTIKKDGTLVIDGEAVYSEGILIYGGIIRNDGLILVQNIEDYLPYEIISQIKGNGHIYLDSQLIDTPPIAMSKK